MALFIEFPKSRKTALDPCVVVETWGEQGRETSASGPVGEPGHQTSVSGHIGEALTSCMTASTTGNPTTEGNLARSFRRNPDGGSE